MSRKESKRGEVSAMGRRVLGMGWNSESKIHDFTVVPGLCPLGTFGEGGLRLEDQPDLVFF